MWTIAGPVGTTSAEPPRATSELTVNTTFVPLTQENDNCRPFAIEGKNATMAYLGEEPAATGKTVTNVTGSADFLPPARRCLQEGHR